MGIRRLHGHPDRSPADLLDAAARWCREHDIAFDVYGMGPVITDLEERVAQMLGFEAGRFMPSGVMAQNIALRIYADHAGLNHVGMHPTSHVEIHEERAYAHLHGLNATLVGPADRPMRAEHLNAVVEPLAAVLVELPIREAGGQLPSWEHLEALKQAAADRSIPLHLDGARLWQCPPFYERSLTEVCAGFSSVYVSFYKDIGALSGAMLLGDADFIAQAAVWQRRQGGTLWSQIPSVATAAMLLDDGIARMPALRSHALSIAAALCEVPGVRVLPDPPHTNLFHVIADGTVEDAREGRARAEAQTGIRPYGGMRPGPIPGTFRVEVCILSTDISPDDARDAWQVALHG